MPTLQQGFSTIKLIFPSYKDSEVTIKTSITIGEIAEIEKVAGDTERAVAVACKMITSWNFTDENGNELPISIEAIKQLPVQDLEFLLNTVNPYLEKKTVSDKTL